MQTATGTSESAMAILPAAAELRLDDGFDAWMVREQRRIYLLCLRLLRDPDDASTATQDAFLRAHAGLRRDDADLIRSPEQWLTRIAVNRCLDRMRSRAWKFWRRRIPQEDERAVLLLCRADSVAPDRAVMARELARRITMAVRRLSTRQQAVFLLRHEEDRSLEEIGELLDLDVGTVKAHLSRAMAKLRGELGDLYERRTSN
jgi:RNA polymerase sigma-70 factor, ECF subfamily